MDPNTKLWESGKWSDLTVVAGNQEFKVHKAILCPRSEFFDKACSSGFSETYSNRIVLEEDACVVENMLGFFYGKQAPCLDRKTLEGLDLPWWNEETLKGIMALHFAAEKYDVAVLSEETASHIGQRLRELTDTSKLIEFTLQIYDNTSRRNNRARMHAAMAVHATYNKIHDTELLEDMLDEQDLVKDLLALGALYTRSKERERY